MFKQTGLIFRQLQESPSSTFTYILGCNKTRKAIIIDPVDTTVERDAKLINELKLQPIYAINTHCHADHITGTHLLKNKFNGLKSVISKAAGARADILVDHDEKISFGDHELICKSTPGHTNGCMSFINHHNRMVFTGDTLMIRKCGRTDFQEGSPANLYDNVYQHLFTLEEDYLVYPGHDYAGFCQSSIGEEKEFNLRLTKSKEEFVKIMENLNLSYPKKIDASLPMNLVDGDGELVEKKE